MTTKKQKKNLIIIGIALIVAVLFIMNFPPKQLVVSELVEQEGENIIDAEFYTQKTNFLSRMKTFTFYGQKSSYNIGETVSVQSSFPINDVCLSTSVEIELLRGTTSVSKNTYNLGYMSGQVDAFKEVDITTSSLSSGTYTLKDSWKCLDLLLIDWSSGNENPSSINFNLVETAECSSGQTKCEETNYYTCSNGKWVNQGKVVGKCGVDCTYKSDCDSDGYVGSKYCSGNNVVQKYKTYSCSNYKCSSSEQEKTLEYCQYGCSNGVCTEPQNPGYIIENNQCVYITSGATYSTLQECESSLVIPSTGYIIQNNQCVYITSGATYPTLQECESSLVIPSTGYIIQNNQCVYITSGATYSTLSECEDNLYEEESPLIIILSIIGIILFIGILTFVYLKSKPKRKRR